MHDVDFGIKRKWHEEQEFSDFDDLPFSSRPGVARCDFLEEETQHFELQPCIPCHINTLSPRPHYTLRLLSVV